MLIPYADFEFRQLLSRMVHRDAEIHVVLFRQGKEKQYEEECRRFKQFFGGRRVSFEPEGAAKFIGDLCRT
jgi:hypothetical protein